MALGRSSLRRARRMSSPRHPLPRSERYLAMTIRTHVSRPSAFAVFRRRNFTLLWIAQFISTMGSGLTAIAASILIYRATGSALNVGIMLLVTALPGLCVGLIAGVIVDRFD